MTLSYSSRFGDRPDEYTDLSRCRCSAEGRGKLSTRDAADTEAIAIWIRQMDLSAPRDILDVGAELGRHNVDITHVEVQQCVGPGVIAMLQ
jgi:hypothetical protein